MRGVHPAGPEESNGHCNTVTDNGGEVLRGGSDSVSSSTGSNSRRWVEEVEGVLRVIQCLHLVDLVRFAVKLGNEFSNRDLCKC